MTDGSLGTQFNADNAFLKIWIGLALTVLTLAVYFYANSVILQLPGFALLGVYLLAFSPMTAKDDYMRSLHHSGASAVVWFVALYLFGCTFAGIADANYEVVFFEDGTRYKREISGTFGYYFDGLLIALFAALTYYIAVVAKHLRGS